MSVALETAVTALRNLSVAVGTDTQRLRDARFETTSFSSPVFTLAGPAHLAASVYRHTREAFYLDTAIQVLDRFALDQSAYGGGIRDSGGNNSPTLQSDIETVEFAAILGKTMLALGDDLPVDVSERWTALLEQMVDWFYYYKWPYYVNGNIEAIKAEATWYAYRITGQPRFAVAYDRQLAFMEKPTAGKLVGWITTTEGTDALGTGGAGYFMESGAGGDGLDWLYTHYQSSILSDLWLWNRDPRILRWLNMIYATLAPRIDKTGPNGWLYNTAGGTRQQVGVTTPAPNPWATTVIAALVVGGARPELAADVDASRSGLIGDVLPRSVVNGNAFFYRSCSRDLAWYLDAEPVA